MTQQDDWRPEMARLAQRQDQLERQQRDSTRNVEALQRDGDALKRDVDRRLDSLRRETDRQFRDRDRRVSRLERSRDTFGNLFWFSMPLVAAVAVIFVLLIAVVASREQRQEAGEPEERSPSSFDAPLAGSGGTWPPGFVAAGDTFPTSFPLRQHQRRPGNRGLRSRELLSFNRSISYGKYKTYFISRGYRLGVEVCQVNPAFSSVIGRVKFMERYGLSVHQAAALVLARRLLRCSERILRRRVCPAGNGVHVAFTVPARKRVKHVWTYWGGVLGQLRPALAAQHRLGKRRRRPNPVQAVRRVEARGVA